MLFLQCLVQSLQATLDQGTQKAFLDDMHSRVRQFQWHESALVPAGQDPRALEALFRSLWAKEQGSEID